MVGNPVWSKNSNVCLANCYEGSFLPLIALRESDEFHFQNASVAGNRPDRGSALQ